MDTSMGSASSVQGATSTAGAATTAAESTSVAAGTATAGAATAATTGINAKLIGIIATVAIISAGVTGGAVYTLTNDSGDEEAIVTPTPTVEVTVGPSGLEEDETAEPTASATSNDPYEGWSEFTADYTNSDTEYGMMPPGATFEFFDDDVSGLEKGLSVTFSYNGLPETVFRFAVTEVSSAYTYEKYEEVSLPNRGDLYRIQASETYNGVVYNSTAYTNSFSEENCEVPIYIDSRGYVDAPCGYGVMDVSRNATCNSHNEKVIEVCDLIFDSITTSKK